jgi:hypothetical protein
LADKFFNSVEAFTGPVENLTNLVDALSLFIKITDASGVAFVALFYANSRVSWFDTSISPRFPAKLS